MLFYGLFVHLEIVNKNFSTGLWGDIVVQFIFQVNFDKMKVKCWSKFEQIHQTKKETYLIFVLFNVLEKNLSQKYDLVLLSYLLNLSCFKFRLTILNCMI